MAYSSVMPLRSSVRRGSQEKRNGRSLQDCTPETRRRFEECFGALRSGKIALRGADGVSCTPTAPAQQRALLAGRGRYRDLKPENVLMNETGLCKLCDMGLAKICVGKTSGWSSLREAARTSFTTGSGSFELHRLACACEELERERPPTTRRVVMWCNFHRTWRFSRHLRGA